MVQTHRYVVGTQCRVFHLVHGLFEDRFAQMLPIDAGDVFGGMTGFVGDDDVFWKVVFVADDADVEVYGVGEADEGLDAAGFVEVGGYGFGGYANVVLGF